MTSEERTINDIDFYDLMQAYRHAPVNNQALVVEAFEEVKGFLNKILEATGKRERKLGYKEAYDYILGLQYSQSPIEILDIVLELSQNLNKELEDEIG